MLHRPTVLPVPGFLLILGLRDFGRSTVVGGQRALPTRLLESGYTFAETDLSSVLRTALRSS